MLKRTGAWVQSLFKLIFNAFTNFKYIRRRDVRIGVRESRCLNNSTAGETAESYESVIDAMYFSVSNTALQRIAVIKFGVNSRSGNDNGCLKTG